MATYTEHKYKAFSQENNTDVKGQVPSNARMGKENLCSLPTV